MIHGEAFAAPHLDAFEKREHKWRNVVVVQFFGKPTNFSLFHHMANKLWERDGAVELCHIDSSLYDVNLPNALARDHVLEYDSWHI